MQLRVVIPGSFDPIHTGHIALIKEASTFGLVTIILKGDRRLAKKKGIALMSAEDRKILLESNVYVDSVYVYDNDLEDHEDFAEALQEIKPNIICFGEVEGMCLEPDYILDLCKELNIEIKYGVGGDIIHSSSQILKDYVRSI